MQNNRLKIVSMHQNIVVIDRDISRNRRLSAKQTYVVASDVHVRKNVTLTIENGTTILIQNGLVSGSKLRRAALIFDPGSTLHARRIYFKACNASFRPEKRADNAGIWFLGNHQKASKDTVTVKPDRKTPAALYKADLIATYYLGRIDPIKESSRTRAVQDDIDGLSILGVGPFEWAVSEVRSFNSGDDGIDLTNSHIRIKRLKVQSPVEDAINLSSSHLEVQNALTLNVNKTSVKDRDLFDFETDDGASFLEIHANCKLDLHGVFGDELHLVSNEMPPPVTRSDNERQYKFTGRLKRAALIYSLDED